ATSLVVYGLQIALITWLLGHLTARLDAVWAAAGGAAGVGGWGLRVIVACPRSRRPIFDPSSETPANQA
ncbi:MAG: hypothetical protein LBL92_04395, partial [Propionibacteriaceae bacterium]|nr:hypothetical protein [Propionibacteriaceae bacterium]